MHGTCTKKIRSDLVHIVDFIISIYRDVRSSECQILHVLANNNNNNNNSNHG